MIQIWNRWNEAIARLVRQPSMAGGGTLTLSPPVSRQAVGARGVAQPEELNDHLKREFARIREEEQNILDKLIMLD